MVRVKFCGITNIEDALDAVDLGVSALGFVFAPSPREINPAKAKEIIEKLPPWVTSVGVFVDEKADTVRFISKQCGLDWIQLHGKETPEYCRSLGLKVYKTIKDDISRIADYDVSAILLDTFIPDKNGGTGKVFDWGLAVKAKKYKKPIILAGGLTPENVGDAIKKVKPYGIDVSSGIEKHPGKKDINKMKRFMRGVHSS